MRARAKIQIPTLLLAAAAFLAPYAVHTGEAAFDSDKVRLHAQRLRGCNLALGTTFSAS